MSQQPITIIYARVSTDAQAHESQLIELREHCVRRGWQYPQEIVDTISGKKNSRLGLDRMMKLVRAGKVSTIVCYKLDRLGRSLSHLAQLVDEFAKHHVALVVTSQGIDTTKENAVGRMQLGMLAVFAEFEHSIILERVNSGLAAAKDRGVRLGRPRTTDAHRDSVAALRAQGRSGRAIAAELGLPTSSVFDLIANLEKAA
jgi:DNA invertase Pin-like site-specific DNA recombinase